MFFRPAAGLRSREGRVTGGAARRGAGDVRGGQHEGAGARRPAGVHRRLPAREQVRACVGGGGSVDGWIGGWVGLYRQADG